MTKYSIATAELYKEGERVFLHHVEGLIPATVVRTSPVSDYVQVEVQGWCGRHWFRSVYVLTADKAERMFGEAKKVRSRS